MKAKFLALIFFLALPLLSFGQDFTTVSGQVEDSLGLPYANGTIAAQLIATSTPVFSDTNQPYSPPTGLVQLDSTGKFSMQLARNAAFKSPNNSSTWTFLVCSVTGTLQPVFGKASSCYQVPGITVSGTSQDVSVPLQNNAQPLTYSASIVLQDSPTCAGLFGPVDLDGTHLDATGKVTAAPSAISSAASVGVAVSVPASGCIGSVQVATGLVVPCVTDNQSSVLDFVAVSGSNGTECTDIGATASTTSFGQVMRANTGSGTISMVLLFGRGGGGGGGVLISCPGAVNGALAAFTTPTSLSCDNASITDFAGDISSQSYQAVGPHDGEVEFTSNGTVPPTALPANTVSLLAPNSIPTSYRINFPPAPGTNGQLLSQQTSSTDGSGTQNIFLNWVSSGGGGGSVTNFLAGNLSPLFTTSVATSTTTPNLSFILSNAGAHTVYGNNTGVSAAPTFFTPVFSCQTGIGDGLNAIPAGTYLQSFCYNFSGVTQTLTGIRCLTDNNGTSTLNATNGAGTALLTGAVTCTNAWAAGTQSGTTTIASGDYIKFTFVADGSSKQTSWAVGLTQ